MHPSSHRSLTCALLLSVFIFAVLVTTPRGQAQATPAASKTMDVSAFGGFTYGSPDYGDRHDTGGTIGANITRYLGWKINPSFEMRASRVNGLIMDQESAFGGLRAQADFGRFHPYVDGLVGGSKIFFHLPPNPRYLTDSAIGYSLGGGVDIDVYRRFQLKIDYQNEFFNYGPNGTVPQNADFTLSPTRLTVGVAYRIPLRAHKSR